MYSMKITVHCSQNLLIVKRVKNINRHTEQMQQKMETSHITAIHAVLYAILLFLPLRSPVLQTAYQHFIFQAADTWIDSFDDQMTFWQKILF